VHGILDLLGEMVNSDAEANGFSSQILSIFEALETKPYPKYASIKLSQLGLDINPELALENAKKILTLAKKVGAFVRIDMEDSPRVEKTISMFRTLDWSCKPCCAAANKTSRVWLTSNPTCAS
jgi:proline dehydrogenase